MPQVTVTIPLSESVSGDIDLREMKRGVIGIGVPVITSGDLYVQGGVDTTSANFKRFLLPPTDERTQVGPPAVPSSGYLTFETHAGSCWIAWPADLQAPEYLRLETGVPQEAPVVFTVLFN